MLLALVSVATSTAWYIAIRTWFQSGTGFWHSVFVPESAWVFAWPALFIVAAWWLMMPRPKFSLLPLLALPVAVFGGMLLGMFLGLAFTCEYINKCM